MTTIVTFLSCKIASQYLLVLYFFVTFSPWLMFYGQYLRQFFRNEFNFSASIANSHKNYMNNHKCIFLHNVNHVHKDVKQGHANVRERFKTVYGRKGCTCGICH